MKLVIEQNIVDWFDPANPSHLKEYVHLEKMGFWREDFLPENVTFPVAWAVLIAHKIADFYLHNVLKLD